MKLLKAFIAVSFLVVGSAQAASYKLDPSHSTVGFSVRHLVVSKVKGHFGKFEGSFEFDEKKMEVSKVDVKIDAASIDTAEAKRDEHLNSPDFFDTKKFPEITFKADKASVKKDKPTKISGTLTMRGVSKPVTLDLTYGGSVVDPWGNEKVGFSMSGKIDRKDFGLTWNKSLDKGGVAVSDEVMLEIEGEAQKEAPAKK